ncbi:protein IQ-DOMAIN 12 isoform X2 [Manihot esculenta]|uniref:Uncharacterized protein n=4 Tax=Manihot esculenta TaxID=3983 RepID=A0ACB7HA85_MANES|nr:protein IQ-DOMAIN 12 isoform X2 [Manihot esculenta]KAG8648954.1 hypothetical protein MANES_08G054200v8 [Manihot esculenta]KAG8648955.1 hypothetical protein MANES_08G054200v8 [Manihot esculenta]KAG8648957.1 hypothetical protein MANES_08G054200v8 [Manihot esculenta]OAY43250.1 hypothetical protein MANES_08G054200v8 [Manihot esculenta]
MAKKICLFVWFKRLFDSEGKPRTEKRSFRWRWILRSLKFKQRPVLPSLPSHKNQRLIDEATEKQRKFAMTAALATKAAAEAAVAAAQAAAEVVRLTGSSQSRFHFTKKDEHFAAIKIQSAFRGFLARKALRALKGLVTLQAIVRGQAVREQVVVKLKRSPSDAKMLSRVRAKSILDIDNIGNEGGNKQLSKLKELGDMDNMLECKSQRSWDYSKLSKEDMESLWFKKQEASIKRDRMMKFSFSQRERRNTRRLEESISDKETGRQNRWLEQLTDKDAFVTQWTENLKSSAISSLSTGEIFGEVQVKTKGTRKQDSVEGFNSPVSFPRRSFCHTQRNAAEDESSALNSPVFPTYMAATESAKAKARSMSTPRQRIGIQDTCFDHSLSYKNRQFLWSSYDGELFGSYGSSSCASQGVSLSINRHC